VKPGQEEEGGGGWGEVREGGEMEELRRLVREKFER